MKVEEMNIDEIRQAGIDVNDPVNHHVFKYETKLKFTAQVITLVDIIIEDEPQEYHRAEINGTSYKVISYRQAQYEVMYMIVTGECKWLKEFYDVQLIVVNRDPNGESLTNCTAELKVPDGLTLINCDKEQMLGDLSAGEAFNIHWYLRGDKAGDYGLSADFKGKNRGEEFKYPFHSSNLLHVYAGDALKMKIKASRYSFFDADYTFEISFENVSDRPIYNIEHNIDSYEQASELTINKYHNGELISHQVNYSVLQKGDLNAKYKIDTLNPGEEVVASVTIHDIWRSILEQNIGDDKYKASCISLIASTQKNPYFKSVGIFADLYHKILDSMDAGHVLGSVGVATLEGSTTEIPYEVIVIEDDASAQTDTSLIKQCLSIAMGNFAPKDINRIYKFLNLIYKDNPTDYCIDYNDSNFEKYLYAYTSYLADSFPYIGKVNNCIKDYYYKVYQPQGSAKVKFFVKRADGGIKYAPNSVINSQNKVEYDDFDIEVVYGDYSVDESGHIVLSSDAIIKVIPKTPNIRATIGAMTEDGKEITTFPVEVIDNHECKGDYMILAQPSEDEGATMAAFCETCQELIECKVLPIDDTAMLSNGHSYHDIKDALTDAAKSDEELKLYIFGRVNIVEDVIISDNLTLVITPETKISVADGCKFVAKGDVKDFSGYHYDLSGNASVVSQTSTTSSSVTTTTTTTTTSTTSSVSTTETSITTISSTITDNTTTSSITSTTNTPTTTDTNIEDTSLPQTGIPTSFDILAIIIAMMTLLTGMILVIRNREENQ